MMQNAMALLSNLIGQKGTDLRPFYQQGAVHLNVTCFDISALRFLAFSEPESTNPHSLFTQTLPHT